MRALKNYGVTHAEVGAVTGVGDRAVRAWATSTIRPPRYDRLAELRDLVLLLSDSLTPSGVGQWLHAQNRPLGAERPLQLIAAGRLDEVRRGVRAALAGHGGPWYAPHRRSHRHRRCPLSGVL